MVSAGGLVARSITVVACAAPPVGETSGPGVNVLGASAVPLGTAVPTGVGLGSSSPSQATSRRAAVAAANKGQISLHRTMILRSYGTRGCGHPNGAAAKHQAQSWPR